MKYKILFTYKVIYLNLIICTVLEESLDIYVAT